MSFFISFGIVILSMLIMAYLQLQPGIFTLFYHYASGKYSKAKTSNLAFFFILGAETTTACLFLFTYCFTNLLFLYQFHPETGFFAWLLSGILITLTIISFFYYYRPGHGSQLFISRKCASNINIHTQNVQSRSDAFILGALSGTCELPFTLPLYIITSIEIAEMAMGISFSDLLACLYIIAPTIPLFIIYWRFQSNHNLADIERSRVKNKIFIRTILSISYLTIAILFIYFRGLTQ